MSVTTPTTGQKISDFSAGIVDADSYFIQANGGSTSKVSASQIGQFSNLNLLFNGTGGLDTTAKTIVGAINEVNRKEASDIADVQAAIDELESVTTGQATLDTTKIDGGGIVYTKVGKIVIVDVNIRFKANIAADSDICSGLPRGSFVHFLLGVSQNIYRAYFDGTTIKMSDVPPAAYCTGMFVYKAN